MSKLFQLIEKTTITGLILVLLGIITFIPEIYLSGIMVMIVSSAIQVHQLETMRVENQSFADASAQTTTETYYSW